MSCFLFIVIILSTVYRWKSTTFTRRDLIILFGFILLWRFYAYIPEIGVFFSGIFFLNVFWSFCLLFWKGIVSSLSLADNPYRDFFFSIYFQYYYYTVQRVRSPRDPSTVPDDICKVQRELFFKQGETTVGWCCRSEKWRFFFNIILLTIFTPVALLGFLHPSINNTLFNFELFFIYFTR